MIKLDIINEVVNKTGITKTKAELAVETVFESMKRSLAKGPKPLRKGDANDHRFIRHAARRPASRPRIA